MEINIIEIRRLSQQFAYSSLQMHETIARQIGFSATDHKYLGFFITKGTLTAGELAELCGLTSGAVTGLIDRFEKKGLIRREYDKTDRRKVFVAPYKEKIIALLEPHYKDYQEQTDVMLSSFSESEKETIASYLKKSIGLMKTINKQQRTDLI